MRLPGTPSADAETGREPPPAEPDFPERDRKMPGNQEEEEEEEEEKDGEDTEGSMPEIYLPDSSATRIR